MNLFRGMEKKLEGLVEGGFGRAFKSSVQPVELAHKLAKEMGDHKTVGVAHVYVPNEFDIFLGRDDYKQLSSLSDSLCAELGSYVEAFAQREGWTMVAAPRIQLHEDRDLHLGEFGIGAGTVSEPASAGEPALGVPAVGAPAPSMVDQTVLYQAPSTSPLRTAPPRAFLRDPRGQWELRLPVTIVGRSRRCDIVIDDPNVSRQHAEVVRQGDAYLIRDLGSTNGVRVNRRAVRDGVLQHGDRIEVGATELVFELVP